MTESPYHSGHHRNSQCGKQSGFHENWLDRIPSGGETSIEHYEDECRFTTALGKIISNISDTQKAMVAEQEAKK